MDTSTLSRFFIGLLQRRRASLLGTVTLLLALTGCDGCLATDECPGFIHRVERLVTVDDTRDTIRAGDTVTFSFLLPWVVTTLFSYELQDSFTFDLRDAPEPTANGVGWHAQSASLGYGPDVVHLKNAYENLERIVLRGGNEIGYLVGDSTALGLEAELAIVFKKPGRYYLVFFAQRTTPDARAEDKYHEYDAYDLTRTDGCRERIGIHTRATNYDINDAAIDAQNAASELQMRVRRGVNDDEADYYVLVRE